MSFCCSVTVRVESFVDQSCHNFGRLKDAPTKVFLFGDFSVTFRDFVVAGLLSTVTYFRGRMKTLSSYDKKIAGKTYFGLVPNCRKENLQK